MTASQHHPKIRQQLMGFIPLALLLAVVLLPSVSANIDEFVLHYWGFEEISGVEPNGISGSPGFTLDEGGFNTNGRIGRSWNLTTGQDINTSGLYSGADSLTIAFWAKPSSAAYAIGGSNIISFGTSCATSTQFCFYDGTSWKSTGVSYSAYDELISHYVWVFNTTSNTYALYINNVLKTASVAYDGTLEFNGAVTVNSKSSSSYAFSVADRWIDELYFFNKALNVTEVEELYNRTTNFVEGNVSRVKASDTYDLSALTAFNVTWSNRTNNFTNTSTSGVAFYNNISGTYNITLVKSGYFNKTYTDVVVGNNFFTGNISRGTVEVISNIGTFNITLTNTANGDIIATNESSSTTGIVFYAPNLTANITVNVTKAGYTYDEFTFLNTQEDESFNATIFIDPSILNITIYDEFTNTQIDVATVTLLKGGVSTNYSTANGSVYAKNLSSGSYEIIYDSPGAYERHYYLTVNSASFSNLRLYLLNESTTNAALVTYELTDENGVEISNGTVKLLRRFFDGGVETYRVVEMSRSDVNGDGGLYIEKNIPFYRFVVDYQGSTILSTSGAQVFDSTLIIRSAVGESIIGSTTLTANLNSSLTYNESTGSFTLTWNDPSDTIINVCLNVTKIRASGITVVNDSCLAASTGSITLGAEGNSTNGLYRAWSRIETNTQNSPHIIEFLEKVRTNILNTVGEAGTFYAALIMITLALAGLVTTRHPGGVLFGLVIGYVGSALLGLMDITFAAVIFAIVVVMIIIYGSRRAV